MHDRHTTEAQGEISAQGYGGNPSRERHAKKARAIWRGVLGFVSPSVSQPLAFGTAQRSDRAICIVDT